MDTRVALAALGAFIVGVVVLPVVGYTRLVTATFFFAVFTAPFAIVLWDADAPSHTGITLVTPHIATYTLALVLLTLGLTRSWVSSRWMFAYGSAVSLYLLIGLFFVWEGNQSQWAGALHWMFALIALAAGYQFAQMTPETYRLVVGLIFTLFVINGAFCLGQLAGLPLSLFPAQLMDHLNDGRPIGTFTHPSTPGKFVLIGLMIVLPATQCSDRATRSLAWWSAGIGIPVVALTLARANLAAVILAVGLWMLLERASLAKNVKRLFLVFIALIAAAPILGETFERFLSDPDGGGRGGIYQTGLRQLTSNLWGGTGPNYYVEVVGQWDQMTAWGFPLHNSFLYPVAELGLVGGVLFMLPVFVMCAIALVNCFGQEAPSPWAKSYLVTFPGMLGIAMTGWGMLSSSTLCFWFFAIGMCAGGLGAARKSEIFLPQNVGAHEKPLH